MTFLLVAFNGEESDRIQEEEMLKISLGSSDFHVVSFSRMSLRRLKLSIYEVVTEEEEEGEEELFKKTENK
jgi:hypothetical protein